MAASRNVLLIALALSASVRVAGAQDRIIDEKHCSLLCKLQRNVTRNAGVSATTPLGGAAVPVERVPGATEGTSRPDPSVIAARRGQVMVDTADDRAAQRREKQRLDRELAGASKLGLEPLPHAAGAQR